MKLRQQFNTGQSLRVHRLVAKFDVWLEVTLLVAATAPLLAIIAFLTVYAYSIAF